jgi:aminomethyltransferase
MPLHYSNGILHEHHTVRTKVGLFDVSHMGELHFSGKDALANIQYLVSNDFSDLEIDKTRYGILVRKDGTAVDDLLVYRMAEEEYLVVVNAANIDKDVSYIKEHLFGDVLFQNISEDCGQIAIQGPLSQELLKRLTPINDMPYYTFKGNVDIAGKNVLISRTGYTGEDGYEIYTSAPDTEFLWNLFLETGKDLGVEPCGLGCRDTLRLEAAMPLFGHELNDETTPLEAGLSMFVKLNKEKFIAQDALSEKPIKRRIGLQLIDRGIAREQCDVYFDGKKVGIVSSGTKSPTLNQSIAMAFVPAVLFKETQFEIDVRGKLLKAEKVKLPFYKR